MSRYHQQVYVWIDGWVLRCDDKPPTSFRTGKEMAHRVYVLREAKGKAKKRKARK